MSITPAIALATTLIGTATSAYGTYAQAKASKKAENLRAKQMRLEASRERRETIRRSQVTRAKAEQAAINQGANASDSSVIGGQNQISATAGRRIADVNANERIGAGIFKANSQYASAGTISSFGAGLQGFGQMLTNNYEVINRLGQNYGFNYG